MIKKKFKPIKSLNIVKKDSGEHPGILATA